MTEWQVVNLDSLSDELVPIETLNERFTYLSKRYPCLYIFLMTLLGMKDRVHAYTEDCKKYENDE